jgi:hypothetical protein
LKHFTSSKFWDSFDALPGYVQDMARSNFELLKLNPAHPSLHFKHIKSTAFRSVRVGISYRALGVSVEEGVQWFWIGSHADYDKLLS